MPLMGGTATGSSGGMGMGNSSAAMGMSSMGSGAMGMGSSGALGGSAMEEQEEEAELILDMPGLSGPFNGDQDGGLWGGMEDLSAWS